MSAPPQESQAVIGIALAMPTIRLMGSAKSLIQPHFFFFTTTPDSAITAADTSMTSTGISPDVLP